MSSPVRILIVDDHLMFREGIRLRLERHPRFEVVGEASSAEEAVRLMGQVDPSIVILDVRLLGTSGIELARRLRRDWPEVKILVLSGYDFDQYVRALSRIGISGYLLKDSSHEALLKALDEIAAGGAVLSPPIASKVMRHASESPNRIRKPKWDLTIREIEILESLSEGLRNEDIAARLGISMRTAETHVSSILSKLGAQNRTEAVRRALEEGLIR